MKNVYDNSHFFKEYQSMREDKINANNLIENPIIKKMMPNIDGKTILDLGCGDGNMDKYFVKNGAKKVFALDISQNMINEAKKVNFDPKITYQVKKMENLSSINQKFDIVYSSLAFHYVKDFDKLITDIAKLLKKGGVLVFSQESPLLTALTFADEEQTKHININGKRYYLLSDYQNETAREKRWNDVVVTKYHRTFAHVVNALIKNGINILEIKDSVADKKAIKMREKYKHEQDRPMFLFVKGQKK